MKITNRKVLKRAADISSWLQDYVGYIVQLREWKSGRIDMVLDGHKYCHMEGNYTTEIECHYTIKKLLSKPFQSPSK